MMREIWRQVVLMGLLCIAIGGSGAAQTDDATATLRQQVGQMFVMSFYGPTLNELSRDFLTTYQPGAIVLLESNARSPSQLTALTNDIQQTLLAQGAPPALIAVDQEGGRIQSLEPVSGFTQWPAPALVAATQDPALARAYGTALATELRAVGINMNLAPVADLLTNPANRVIGSRAYGNDPALVSLTIADVIRGMQEGGVLATAKHFPGHGDTLADSHIELPVVPDTLEALSERELLPFQAAIDAEVGAIMTAHVQYSALQPTGYAPGSLSFLVVDSLLRSRLGYDGLVMTDALDMDAIDRQMTTGDAAVRAVQAGSDLVLVGAHVSFERQAAAIDAVVVAVEAGIIPHSRIEQSNERIRRAKEALGLFSWEALSVEEAASRIPLGEHQRLIARLFQGGITIARNQGDVLPLGESVGFIYPPGRLNIWRACNLDGWRPLSISWEPTAQEIDAARRLANAMEQIVVITENVALYPRQRALIQALPAEKTVVVALQDPLDYQALPETAGYVALYSAFPIAWEPLCGVLRGEQAATGVFPFVMD